MKSTTSSTLESVAALAALGEQVLALVKESGLAKPRKRAKRAKVRVKEHTRPAPRQAREAEPVRRPRPSVADTE